jgi:DNA mismatch repair protein MutS2
LGGAFDTLIITGPNTGGKTVALKTLGLLSLMAACGLFIPAAEGSRAAVFSRVLADIGDEQSIEQNLSTFSAHMTNLVDIIGQAESGSLVLLDELGAGTDPVEGAALAAEILEELRRKGALITATTHYAELKAYALKTPGVTNASCEFDVETLRPTYRLLTGVPGRSNAFAISRRLGLSPGVIERAGARISSEDRRFEEVLAALEQAKKDAVIALAAAEDDRREAQNAAEEARRVSREREQEAAKMLEEAGAAARRITEKAKLTAAHVTADLENLLRRAKTAPSAELVTEARATVKAGEKALFEAGHPATEAKAAYKLPRPLKIGDRVKIADIDKAADVLSLPDGQGTVLVQAGIVKTRVPQENLRLIEEYAEASLLACPPPQPHAYANRTPAARSESRVTRTSRNELDLRGLASDEALLELDTFIDGALMSGISQIAVIHGKGTGVLRAAAQNHLRTHRSVKSFRLGVYGEGEDGVTIAELV